MIRLAWRCKVSLLLLWVAPLGAADQPFTIDLSRCEIAGYSMERVLRWTEADLPADSPRRRIFTELQTEGYMSRVYLGVCSVDGAHGQQVVVDLLPNSVGNLRGTPRIVPPLRGGMNPMQVEAVLGAPDAGYRPLQLSGNRLGSIAGWSGLCRDFTVRLRFGADQRLKGLDIYPF